MAYESLNYEPLQKLIDAAPKAAVNADKDQQSALRYASGMSRQMGSMGRNMVNQYQGFLQSAKQSTPDYGYLTAQAGTDAAMSFDKGLDMTARNLARMGVNPNSGRVAATLQNVELARSAAVAGAMTRARRKQAEQMFSDKMQLAQLASPLLGAGQGAMSSAAQMQATQLAPAYGERASGAAYLATLENAKLQTYLDDIFGGDQPVAQQNTPVVQHQEPKAVAQPDNQQDRIAKSAMSTLGIAPLFQFMR